MNKQKFMNQLVKKPFSRNFQIFATSNFLKQNSRVASSKNIKFFQKLINEIAQLKIDYPQNREFLAAMIVIPRELYAELSGNPFGQGINGNLNPFDEVFKTAIYIDEQSFLSRNDWSEIDILHEISHIVHGAFFGIYPFDEGFADALPLYVLDLEKTFPEHVAKIRTMSPRDFLSLAQIRRRGMNPPREIKQNLPIALRKSYIVIYLIVRGILQRLTMRNGGDKVAALNEFLRQFREFQPLANEGKLTDRTIYDFTELRGRESWKTLQTEARNEICQIKFRSQK